MSKKKILSIAASVIAIIMLIIVVMSFLPLLTKNKATPAEIKAPITFSYIKGNWSMMTNNSLTIKENNSISVIHLTHDNLAADIEITVLPNPDVAKSAFEAYLALEATHNPKEQLKETKKYTTYVNNQIRYFYAVRTSEDYAYLLWSESFENDKLYNEIAAICESIEFVKIDNHALNSDPPLEEVPKGTPELPFSGEDDKTPTTSENTGNVLEVNPETVNVPENDEESGPDSSEPETLEAKYEYIEFNEARNAALPKNRDNDLYDTTIKSAYDDITVTAGRHVFGQVSSPKMALSVHAGTRKLQLAERPGQYFDFIDIGSDNKDGVYVHTIKYTERHFDIDEDHTNTEIYVYDTVSNMQYNIIISGRYVTDETRNILSDYERLFNMPLTIY